MWWIPDSNSELFDSTPLLLLPIAFFQPTFFFSFSSSQLPFNEMNSFMNRPPVSVLISDWLKPYYNYTIRTSLVTATVLLTTAAISALGLSFSRINRCQREKYLFKSLYRKGNFRRSYRGIYRAALPPEGYKILQCYIHDFKGQSHVNTRLKNDSHSQICMLTNYCDMTFWNSTNLLKSRLRVTNQLSLSLWCDYLMYRTTVAF